MNENHTSDTPQTAAALTREGLLAATQLPRERIDIPELGGFVFVQGMSADDRDAFEASLVTGRGKKRDVDTHNVRAKLAVRCLVDEQGTRLFKDHEAPLLGRIRVDVLQRVFDAAQRLSGIRDEDVDELGKS